MASYVETATLRVDNQSSKPIAQINRDLRSLVKTVGALKGKPIVLDVRARGLGVATKQINALVAATGQLRRNMTIAPSMRGISSMSGQLSNLNKQLAQTKSLIQQVNAIQPRGSRGGGRPGSTPVNPGRAYLDFSEFRSFTRGFISSLGATIQHAITEGFREGTKRVDTATNRASMLGWKPGQIAIVDAESARLARENREFTTSDFRTLFAELGPILGADPTKSTPLIELAAEYGKIQLGSGKDADQAFSGIREVFKALDNMNRLQDDSGKISPLLQDYFKVLLQETIRAGADIKPEQVNTAVKFARTYGKTMSPEGFRTLMQLVESMGRVAGSSTNRFVEQLHGATTVAAIQEQAAWGLVSTKEVEEGKTGGKSRTKVVREETEASQLLRENPNQWVVEELIPRLMQRGVDIGNVTAVANAIAPLFGSVVARDVATNLVSWQAEAATSREASMNTQDGAGVRGTLDRSGWVQLVAVWRQVTELAGTMGDSMLRTLAPAMISVNNAIQSLTNYINQSENGWLASLMVGGGIAGGGLLAFQGIKGIAGGFGLSASATALNVSAANLNAAAANLGSGGGVPGQPGNGQQGGNGPGGKTSLGINTRNIWAILQMIGAGAAMDAKGNIDPPQYIKDFEKALEGYSPADAMKPNADGSASWLSKFLFGDMAEGKTLKEAMAIDLGGAAKEASTTMTATFDAGAAAIDANVAQAAAAAGVSFEGDVMSTASPWGATAAASFRASIGDIPVTITATAGPDTGKNTNGER